jgi:hypothetical protein
VYYSLFLAAVLSVLALALWAFFFVLAVLGASDFAAVVADADFAADDFFVLAFLAVAVVSDL